MMARNPGCTLDLDWINNVRLKSDISKTADNLPKTSILTSNVKKELLLKVITCMDLTSLGANDTEDTIVTLCHNAASPLPEDLAKDLNQENTIHTAAVCVYPIKIEIASKTLAELGYTKQIKLASVAAGFPSGQYPLHTRLEEIRYAVSKGADEIDIVINRSLVLTEKWEELYNEIKEMKEACGPEAHMKTILSCGELETLENVYKASIIAMMAGSDFIKTSTGKETVNATIPFGIVMAKAIKEYFNKNGHKVGLKPAGGIRTSEDALSWFILVKEVLGDEWLTPELFRIGASGLLTDIQQTLQKLLKEPSETDQEASYNDRHC